MVGSLCAAFMCSLGVLDFGALRQYCGLSLFTEAGSDAVSWLWLFFLDAALHAIWKYLFDMFNDSDCTYYGKLCYCAVL